MIQKLFGFEEQFAIFFAIELIPEVVVGLIGLQVNILNILSVSSVN